jgi:hypothetical protein
MSDMPPSNPGPDDLDEHYRRAARQAGSRPSDAVRRAILEHAAQRAAEHAAAHPSQPAANDPLPLRRRAARWSPRWPLAVFGTLAAAGIAGLLVAPQLPWNRALPEASVARSVPSRVEPFPATPLNDTAARATAVAPSAELPAPARPAFRQLQSQREAAAQPQAAAPAPFAAAPVGADQAAAGAAIAAKSAPMAGPAAAMRAAAAPRPALPRDANSVMAEASASGDLSRLQVLLREGADINAVDARGRTALLIATENAQAAAVDALLAHGADPNIADARGRTPLAIARAASETEIVAALQRAGAH